MTEDDSGMIWKEILRFAKFSAMQLRQILLEELKNDQEKLAYELSDGERSTREIGKEVGVSHPTIQGWWNRWFEIGIVEPTEKYRGKRFKRICQLRELGIRVPKKIIPKRRQGKKET